MQDVIIIGSGPAGVSAALYIARANLHVTVIGRDGGALMQAEKIENYYGTGALSGPALHAQGLEQLAALHIPLIEDEVVNIEWEDGYRVTLRGGEALASRAVILCTGAKRAKPPLANLADFEGRGVSYCAVCDAFFHRGKDVAVLGDGAYALHEAEVLLPIAQSVCVLTNGKPPAAAFPDTLRVDTRPLAALEGDTALRAVRFADGDALPLSGLFVALGTAGASDLARKLGTEVRGADVVTDADMATMLPGLFAAGDCTGGVLQVSMAAAEGAKAALACIRFLRGAGA